MRKPSSSLSAHSFEHRRSLKHFEKDSRLSNAQKTINLSNKVKPVILTGILDFTSIYFLVKGDKVVYVGQSKTYVENRISFHVRDKDFDFFYYFKVDNEVGKKIVDAIEYIYIIAFNAVCNLELRTAHNFGINKDRINTIEQFIDKKIPFDRWRCRYKKKKRYKMSYDLCRNLLTFLNSSFNVEMPFNESIPFTNGESIEDWELGLPLTVDDFRYPFNKK